MTLALILVSVIALVAIAVLAAITIQSRAAPGPSLVGRTVVVHTRRPDSRSVRGVLVGQHADRYILREPVYLEGDTSVDVAGPVHIPVLGVSTIQEIQPVAEPT